MPGKEISHFGVVKEITPEKISVEIVSESACGACSAAGVCSAAEAKKKEISLPASAYGNLSVGDRVEVVLKPSMGVKAVVLAYVLPLAVLIPAVVALSYTGISELLVGLAGICGAGLYYGILFFFKDKLSKEYVFELRK